MRRKAAQDSMTNTEHFQESFDSELSALKELGLSWGLSNDQVQQCVERVFCTNHSEDNEVPVLQETPRRTWVSMPWKSSICAVARVVELQCRIILTIIVVYCVVMSCDPFQLFIMRYSQGLIYPVLRNVRLLTLPIVKRFDSLTELHEEVCLVKNPFYHEPPLDCWPCRNVRTVVDLTGLHNYSTAYCNNHMPFLVRDVMMTGVTIDKLREVFNLEKEALVQGTAKINTNVPDTNSLADLWSSTEQAKAVFHTKDLHVAWKMNRVSAAGVMRKIFKRPYFVPNTSEVALERFLFIDGPESPQYSLPVTDFSNVWLNQGEGHRLIVLDPSESCHGNCSTVSVLMKPKDVLYYNWQFWRPRSLPARLTSNPSISFVGSFY